jgi:hypothetical protein
VRRTANSGGAHHGHLVGSRPGTPARAATHNLPTGWYSRPGVDHARRTAVLCG